MQLTSNAVEYAWRQLAIRLGLHSSRTPGGFESLGLETFYGPYEHYVGTGPALIIEPAAPGAWNQLIALPPASLEPLKISDVYADLPLLLPSRRDALPWVEIVEGRILIFRFDILSSMVFTLGRAEEINPDFVDRHDRFEGIRSVAYRQRFLHRPILDEYATLVRRYLERILPSWKFQLPQSRLLLSHDIDFPTRKAELTYHSPVSYLRSIAAALIIRRDLPATRQKLRALIPFQSRLDLDDYYQGFLRLLQVSAAHKVASAFYFMTSPGGPNDPVSDPSKSPIAEMIALVQSYGQEVGFHAGYSTFLNPTRLATEANLLAMVLGNSSFGGRQHLLRFRAPETWRHWAESGLKYDSTLGYSDHEGFRCGTCWDYSPFDIQLDREISVIERPLVAMDATLFSHRNLSPEQAETILIDLARRALDVRGNFTLLWHNSSFTSGWRQRGFDTLYERLIPQLAAMFRND